MQLRWGICGSGKICHDFVNALKLLSLSEHKICAIAASNLDRAKSFATDNGIDNYFGSYDQLAQCQDVDIIYVGVVNSMHKKLVLLSLEHGKHVLCEKPLGINVAEVKEMVETARRKKVFLMEAYWSRFFPVYKFLKTQLEDPSFGSPKIATANFGFPLHADVMDKDLGGGALLSIGCYCTMLSMFIFKEKPQRIVATGFLNAQGTDDTISVTFMYDDNKLFQFLQCGSGSLENRAVIYGTKGSQITLPSSFWCPIEINTTKGGLKTFPLPQHGADIRFNYPHSEGLSYEAQCVYQCIKAGQVECECMSLDESIKMAEINDEIRRQLGVHYDQDK